MVRYIRGISKMYTPPFWYGTIIYKEIMGQYYNGTKIGTCENMYYLRLEKARKLAEMGACDDDNIPFLTYVNDGETRFRFPFPQEDEMADDLVNAQLFDEGFLVPCPEEVEISHATICMGSTLYNKTDNVNVFIPCLHSKEFKETGIKTSTPPFHQFLKVCYKAMRPKIVNGEETKELVESTLFECARCGQLQRVSHEEMEKIKEMATEYYTAKYKLVAQRDLENETLVAQNAKALALALETIKRM